MLSIIVIIAAFIGVTALVGGVAVVFRGESHRLVEDRLDALTSTRKVEPKGGSKEASLLAHPLDGDAPTVLEVFVSRFGNLRRLLEQADVSMQPAKFILCSIVMSIASAAVALFCGLSSVFVPVMAIAAGLVPLLLVIFKRKRRLNSFAKFLPDALELIARALRAGHSLAAGFKLVADEMSDPIGTEFGRVYEEQNLGIPLEQAIEDLSDRIPNLDLRFFATAVILQRQTGGDLAEILDKIGQLVRERFKIWGAIQALTGEGRLSGIVLLGLPPALFIVIYRLNAEYIQVLFRDPLGKQMLAVAVFMQIVGALVIRKIVNIKV